MHGTDTTYDGALVRRVESGGHGKLCVRRNGSQIKPRKYIVVDGFGPDHNLGVYNNGVDAVVRALTERYYFVKDKNGPGFRDVVKPTDGNFDKLQFTVFRDRVMAHMPDVPRLSLAQVVQRYTGAKRRTYEEAHLSLLREPLTERDARLDMFVKFEKQDLSKAPRGINPRTARLNLTLGRELKPAEKPFYRSINKAFKSVAGHTVIKGLNADESAHVLHKKWMRFDDPVAVGLDAEKFDAHVSKDALLFEHSFYHRLFPGSKQMKWILKQQLNNKGLAVTRDGSVRFSIEGTRASGDLNTSLGNCLIMCGCIFAYAAERDVEVELANNGDDCVVFMERRDLSRFSAGLAGWFRDCGFSMVAEEPVYQFEEIEFCQTKPVLLNGKWRMVRNHTAVLRKDPMCLIAIQNDKVFKKWMGGVGRCGAHLARGVPVQQHFYDVFVRHGLECSDAMLETIYKNSGMRTRLQSLEMIPDEITPQARVSYYYAFGILPDEQVAIEQNFSHMVMGDVDFQPIEREYLRLEPGIKLI